MSDPVLQAFRLGAPPWPTFDPFLFCVHHVDSYPAANGRFGPAASLAGRNIGQDFAGLDGWRMYHGQTVPGFPQHPHRGFETVTVVRKGLIDHSDSLGAAARYGDGDVQWLTAGRGISHAEMFPLLREDAPNPAELFQIWMNLPGRDKLADPHFSMLWAADVPHVDADGASVTVVAGAWGDRVPPPPPPRSWAADPAHEVAIWTIVLTGGRFVLPVTGPATARTLYVFEGAVQLDGKTAPAGTGLRLRPGVEVALSGTGQVLLLQGVPIGEPVAHYGPFVMNTEAELRQAFTDYQRTRFGGWPWPDDAPVHGPDPTRFARVDAAPR